MRRLFIIRSSVFDMETLVAINVSDKDILKWVGKNTVLKRGKKLKDAIRCEGLGRTFAHGSFSMLRLDGWKDDSRGASHLAHEAFHLAEFTFRRIGLKYDFDSSGEAWAYFIQHIVNEVLEGVREK